MIETWPITSTDIPWMLDLAVRRYPEFDQASTVAWMKTMLAMPSFICAIRSADAFVVGNVDAKVWQPWKIDCHLIFLCAEEGAHWQAQTLLRSLLDWAITGKAGRLFLASDTYVDIEIMARRLRRQVRIDRRYVLDLEPYRLH